jgi:beta-glucanase (GH16 family)
MNAKRILLKMQVLLLFAVFPSLLYSQLIIPYNSPCGTSDFKLLWMDDFNSLDLNRWVVLNDYDQWGSQHVHIADNVVVENGFLNLQVKKEDYQCPIDGNGNTFYDCHTQAASNDPPNFYYKYTSGAIESVCSPSFQYGYFEARIAFADEDGWNGAFWTY